MANHNLYLAWINLLLWLTLLVIILLLLEVNYQILIKILRSNIKLLIFRSSNWNTSTVSSFKVVHICIISDNIPFYWRVVPNPASRCGYRLLCLHKRSGLDHHTIYHLPCKYIYCKHIVKKNLTLSKSNLGGMKANLKEIFYKGVTQK